MSTKNNKDVELIVSMPEETTAETFLKTIKNFADIFLKIPFVGDSISKALEHSLGVIYEKRFAEFIENINRAMRNIPEKIYTSEEFADVTRITLKNFLEESSEIKRANILKIYEYYINHGFERTVNQDEVVSHSILDSCLLWEKVAAELSEGSFLFFIEIKEQQNVYGKEKCTDWWGDMPVRTLTPVYVGELVTYGLIEEQIWQMPVCGGVDRKVGYHVSQAGEEFLTWLDMNK